MSEPVTYRQAGVNIDTAQAALRSVSEDIRRTHSDKVIGGIGGFGALFRAYFPDLSEPILVSSIDGVGTKTRVAAMSGEFGGLGADIVNHCVNDILCQGASPLFFMDYFGASHLNPAVFESVLRSASEACLAVNCSLVGGETAEMPGVYVEDEIDIVGSIVGVVDYDKRLPRAKILPGDSVIGLTSSGLHTNGYSLARRVLFDLHGMSVRDEVESLGTTLGAALLEPHRCYYNSVMPLLQQTDAIKALVHITGGGFYDNIARVLPSGSRAMIDRSTWEVPPIFRLIEDLGGVPSSDMYRTFNMGIGLVLITESGQAPSVKAMLRDLGEAVHDIGEIVPGTQDVIVA